MGFMARFRHGDNGDEAGFTVSGRCEGCSEAAKPKLGRGKWSGDEVQLIVEKRKRLQCLEEQWKWAGSQLCRSAGTVPNLLISEFNQRWRRIGASAHIACDRKSKRSLDPDSLNNFSNALPSFRRCPAAASMRSEKKGFPW